MATATLQSFITAHERKFQEKLDAVARERQPEVHRQTMARVFPDLPKVPYQSAIQRRFVTRDRIPYLHYEVTPRD